MGGRAPLALLFIPLAVVCAACPSPPPAATEPATASADEPGPACASLRRLTERTQGCHLRPEHRLPDPRTLELMAEDDCVALMRTITTMNTKPAEVSSVHTHRDPAVQAPLGDGEVKSWDSFQLSAIVTILPDLAPRPGRPLLEAFVDGAKVRGTEGPVIEAFNQAPGPHELVLRHAGIERTYCLALNECDLVTLRAHGAAIAPNEAVTEGPCAPKP